MTQMLTVKDTFAKLGKRLEMTEGGDLALDPAPEAPNSSNAENGEILQSWFLILVSTHIC